MTCANDRVQLYAKSSPAFLRTWQGLPFISPEFPDCSKDSAEHLLPRLDSVHHLTLLTSNVPDDMLFYQHLLNEQLQQKGTVTLVEVMREWDQAAACWRMLVLWREDFYRMFTVDEQWQFRMRTREQGADEGRYMPVKPDPDPEVAKVEAEEEQVDQRWLARTFSTAQSEGVHWYMELLSKVQLGDARISFSEIRYVGGGEWHFIITASEYTYGAWTADGKPDRTGSAESTAAGDRKQVLVKRRHPRRNSRRGLVHGNADRAHAPGPESKGKAQEERAVDAVAAQCPVAGGHSRSLTL